MRHKLKHRSTDLTSNGQKEIEHLLRDLCSVKMPSNNLNLIFIVLGVFATALHCKPDTNHDEFVISLINSSRNCDIVGSHVHAFARELVCANVIFRFYHLPHASCGRERESFITLHRSHCKLLRIRVENNCVTENDESKLKSMGLDLAHNDAYSFLMRLPEIR